MDEILNMAEGCRKPSDWEEAICAMFVPHLVLAENIADQLLGLDRAKLEWEKRHEILRKAWSLLTEYKDQMSSADKQHVYDQLTSLNEDLEGDWAEWKEARRSYSEQRQASFRERVEARIEQQDHERLSGVLEHKRGHLQELEEQRDSAWSDSFRDRVSDWIDQEESAIQSIEEKLDRIEATLKEEKDKLD